MSNSRKINIKRNANNLQLELGRNYSKVFDLIELEIGFQIFTYSVFILSTIIKEQLNEKQ